MAKGKEGDIAGCQDSGGLSTGQKIGLSAIPMVGGLLALGSMVANEVAEDNLKSDDCDLGETKAEGTESSTENTESPTGDTEEEDSFEKNFPEDDEY